MKSQRGVTLMELIIAITLVSLISTGMLMAMRISLVTLEKTNTRLEDDRRALALQQILIHQISDVMPVRGDCAAQVGGTRVPVFSGDGQSLRLITSYSIGEGARGYPRLVEYLVRADPQGGYVLTVNEQLYSGPSVTAPMCNNGTFLPVMASPQALPLATRLASCRISYREYLADTPLAGSWVPVWNRPNLPAAVRIEMSPLTASPGQLPALSVYIPIHVTREVEIPYDDQ